MTPAVFDYVVRIVDMLQQGLGKNGDTYITSTNGWQY